MKILMVNYSDIQGGAARAAYRLHRALLDENIDSQMLVQSKSSDDLTVIGPKTKIEKIVGKLSPILDSLPVWFYKNRGRALFSPSWLPFSSIVYRINKIKPDIVHLHWVAGGMMRIEDLAKIKAPIVWSLHDMWAFTDGYHYDAAFDIQNEGHLEEPKISIQSKIFKRKAKTYKKLNHLTVIGLSNWLNNCSKHSKLLGDKPHIYLPNPINTVTFAPFDKIQARALFNLPARKKLILFGGAISDPRKGYKELSEALVHVSTDYELVVFGSSKLEVPKEFKQITHYLGYLHDDVSLRLLYSAADVMIVPSLKEAFGQTACESLACGTPVVAFGTTGLLDIVDHQQNGYLAKPFDTSDLAKGVEWVINTPNYNQLCQNARNKVLRKFDSRVLASKYIDLYLKVMRMKHD